MAVGRRQVQINITVRRGEKGLIKLNKLKVELIK